MDAAEEQEDNFDADDFVLYYLRWRIECDGKYRWYDPPQLPDALPPACEIVRDAARIFEKEKAPRLNQLLNPLIAENKLNSQTFGYILNAYLDRVAGRNAANAENGRDALCFTLVAIISFSGFFARRLAELDVEQAANWQRDFRREINQLSIYASKTLQRRISEIEGYSWVKFCEETGAWMRGLEEHRGKDKRKGLARNIYMISVILGATVGIGALILLRHRLTNLSAQHS